MLINPNVDTTAAEVAQALVRVSHGDQVSRIFLPMLFPGGSMVSVEISKIRDGFLVSDAGAARREAGLWGGEQAFARIARDVAKRFAIRFDQNMMFDLDITLKDLVPAVIAVGNAAKTAVENTSLYMAGNEHADYKTYLWRKLAHIYGGDSFRSEPAPFRGAQESWEFDASVTHLGRLTLFEIVSAHANSVNSAVTKFVDVKDLGEQRAPQRIAVLVSKDTTPRLSVLNSVARILPLDATEEQFRLAA